MNIFGIGLPEMAVIAAIGLLVFGPKRLPELGKTLGRTLRGFQSASQEFEQEFRSAIAPTETLTATAATSLASATGPDGALAESSASRAASTPAGLAPDRTTSSADGSALTASLSELDAAPAHSLASTQPVEPSPQPAETLS